MIKVAVNGYGTIGRRVAEAITKQKDMKLVGVAKATPDYKSKLALERGISVFAIDEKSRGKFKEAGVRVDGALDDLLKQADLVVDASPEDIGAVNKQIYDKLGIKAIFQGGEEPEIAEMSFNAYANYGSAVGKRSARVVSCNTTGIIRTIWPIKKEFGIKKVRVFLVRRATDPDDSSKGPIDSIVPEKKVPSHHGPDVQTVIPDINIETVAIKVPTTRMHIHHVSIELDREVSADQVLAAWKKYNRIMLFSFKDGIDSTARMMDYARELGRSRSDLYEIGVWQDSLNVRGGELQYFQAVHQESDVVPENIDAIRALASSSTQEESIALTDSTLGISRVRK